jgi:hypothetical protein
MIIYRTERGSSAADAWHTISSFPRQPSLRSPCAPAPAPAWSARRTALSPAVPAATRPQIKAGGIPASAAGATSRRPSATTHRAFASSCCATRRSAGGGIARALFEPADEWHIRGSGPRARKRDGRGNLQGQTTATKEVLEALPEVRSCQASHARWDCASGRPGRGAACHGRAVVCMRGVAVRQAGQGLAPVRSLPYHPTACLPLQPAARQCGVGSSQTRARRTGQRGGWTGGSRCRSGASHMPTMARCLAARCLVPTGTSALPARVQMTSHDIIVQAERAGS